MNISGIIRQNVKKGNLEGYTMREKEVKLLKVCMGADDRELARYAKTKLKDKGFLIEENVV